MFACSENALDPGDGPGDAAADVTSLLAQMDAGTAAASSSMSSGGTSTPPPDTGKQNASACVYDTPLQGFKCPTKVMPNGMKYDMFFQLLDASHQPQQMFDTATTKAIRRVTDRSGTMNQPLMTQNGPVPATQEIVGHEDMTLSGIRTNAPEQSGTGTMSNKLVPEGMPSADINSTQTFSKIVFPPPPAVPPAPGSQPTPVYPKSGSITSVITSKTGSQPSVTTTQVTTYDGTPIAKTVITLPNGMTRTCTYDMSAKTPSPPNCTTP
jgi:hypothetical protein